MQSPLIDCKTNDVFIVMVAEQMMFRAPEKLLIT